MAFEVVDFAIKMVEPEVRNVYSSGGSTYVAYTKNGDHLLVAGSSGLIRNYKVGAEDSEPNNIDILDEISDLAVFGDDKVAVSSKIGEVELYSLKDNKAVGKVIRSSLPLRSTVFTHIGTMVAAAGDDDEVQIADLSDNTRVIKLKVNDQVHDISYNSTIDLISISLSNGEIKMYSLTSEEPQLLATIKDEIPKLIYQDDDEEAEDNVITTRVEWNPNGDHFAIPSESKDIKVFSRSENYKQVYSFPRLHQKNLADLKWSPNGDYLASADIGNTLIIWDSESRDTVLEKKLDSRVNNLAWAKNNADGYDLAVGSENGDAYIFSNVVKAKKAKGARLNGISALVGDEADISVDEGSDQEEANADDINSENELTNDEGDDGEKRADFFDDDDGFVDDDDGQGYVIPTYKRTQYDDRGSVEPERSIKRSRPSTFIGAKKYKLKPYSPGCTPYISDRRYLTINSIGYVSTVKQDSHSSITVSFFDTSVHREYHFEDLYGYDLASLNTEGILLGVSGNDSNITKILFRPHENVNEAWEKNIPTSSGEIITSISLSDSVILVCTSFGYIRSFTLFGLPIGLQKSSPVLASATNTNYMFTVSLSNNNQLIYNLQDLEGRFLQRDLTLPLELQNDADLLKGIFFSTYGDPVIVGTDGVILVLARWRTPLQATWVPILDSEEKVKEIGGKGDLSVWPLGLHANNLNCIIVRGSQFPTYPLPLPSELEIKLPTTKDSNQDDIAEEQFLRSRTMGELLGETLANDGEIFEEDNERLNEYAIAHDRAVLQLFANACQEGKNAKAWRLAREVKQDHGLVACNKIAERIGLVSLSNRINKLREQRMEEEVL